MLSPVGPYFSSMAVRIALSAFPMRDVLTDVSACAVARKCHRTPWKAFGHFDNPRSKKIFAHPLTPYLGTGSIVSPSQKRHRREARWTD
jgi:hypothetical protein